jgi:hypothetical protein
MKDGLSRLTWAVFNEIPDNADDISIYVRGVNRRNDLGIQVSYTAPNVPEGMF